MKQQISYALITIGLVFLFSAYVAAVPEGPDSVIRGPSERKVLESDGGAQPAQAGNMTPLRISSQRVSARWQGFYGNISGGVTLDDANNFTIYSWGLVSPSGEIYASNGSSVNWLEIHCINFSADISSGTQDRYNLSVLNNFIGLGTDIEQAGDESVNATFNETYGDDGSTFDVGQITIDNEANCSMTRLFNGSAMPSDNYQEVLLSDNASIIFTSIIAQDQVGFQNATVDFEMIVGVNGTDSATLRNYYFFVELS